MLTNHTQLYERITSTLHQWPSDRGCTPTNYAFAAILMLLLSLLLLFLRAAPIRSFSDNSTGVENVCAKHMVRWCLWWLNGIPGKTCRWRLMSTGANHQRKALSIRARDGDTDKLLSTALILLLLPENTPDSLWNLLVTLVFSWLNLFVYVLKIILTALPACSLKWPGVEVHEQTWYDKWKAECTAV